MVHEQVQVDESPEGAQQLSSPVQLGQGGDHLSAAQQLPPGQQPRAGDNVHVQLQRQTARGGIAPNMGPQQTDERWESPEVTVQVRPQKPSPRWEAPSVTVQVQLQQRGQGPALPQVTVQVQPQERVQGMAGIKVTVQLQLGRDPEEVTCLQDQGEGVLGNGEQLTPKQNQGEPMARTEGERELAAVELVPQRAPSQKQDEGEVTKPQQDQSQEEERAQVVELQEMQVGDEADLDEIVTEEQLQDQSQELEQLKADLPPQKESQRATEVRQEQGDVQEGPKGTVEDQKEDLVQEVSKKRPQETPNYFVAIPITDDQVF